MPKKIAKLVPDEYPADISETDRELIERRYQRALNSPLCNDEYLAGMRAVLISIGWKIDVEKEGETVEDQGGKVATAEDGTEESTIDTGATQSEG
ncbi:hypothetical protein AABM27_03580 [Heyndrickxia faecalis]|uniref:hypothetical protein n=1 Tax=Heyndrickxia TaxID=2837504 RepID=UPI002F3C6599